MEKWIRIIGAREHNLKNIDIQIPKNTFTVITGLSGSDVYKRQVFTELKKSFLMFL